MTQLLVLLCLIIYSAAQLCRDLIGVKNDMNTAPHVSRTMSSRRHRMGGAKSGKAKKRQDEEDIWTRLDWQPNEVLREMYGTRTVIDPDGKKIKYTSGISPREGSTLYDFVKEDEKIVDVLEVGLAYGTSALYMCQALRDAGRKGKLTSIDPFQSTQWSGIGVNNIKKAGLDDLHELIEKGSEIALPKLLDLSQRSNRKFDMVFIDGMHLFDYTLLDIFYSVKLLRIGGILAIDDIKHAGVAAAVSFIDANYEMLEKVPTKSSGTMGIYRKIAEDTREWHFHKAF